MGRKVMVGYSVTPAIDKSFGKRRNRVMRRHSKLSQGYLLSNNHDGLAIARVRPRSGSRGSMLTGLLFAVVAVLGFKAFAIGYVGQPGYDQRIALLADGTASERAAAFLLQADPASAALARQGVAVLQARGLVAGTEAGTEAGAGSGKLSGE